MLFATMCFVCMKIFVKLLPHLPILEIIFCRSVFSLAWSYTVLRAQGISPFGQKENRKWLLIRGAGGLIALCLYFYLIQQIPLASSYSIQYLAPVFTTCIAWIWLKEPVERKEWLWFGVALTGVLVVYGFDLRVSLEQLLIGLLATLFMGFTYVVIRRMRGKEHPLVVVFYFPLVALPVITPYVLNHWVPPTGKDWMCILMVGACTQTAQYYSTRAAFEATRLSKISVVSYLGIVFALLAGFLFNEYYTLMSYLGMIIIVISVWMSVRK